MAKSSNKIEKPASLFKPMKGDNPGGDIERGAAEPIRAVKQKFGMAQDKPADSILKNKPKSGAKPRPPKGPGKINTGPAYGTGKATNPY